jgi:hypothetical protein
MMVLPVSRLMMRSIRILLPKIVMFISFLESQEKPLVLPAAS